MRSVLRQFIRESLMHEAVGQDPFFKMTGDSNLKIPKAGIGLNNALVEAIANSPFLSSIWGSLKILVPSASTLAAATAVSIGTGIALVTADDGKTDSDLDRLKEFLIPTGDDENSTKKTANQTEVANFNKALQGLLAGDAIGTEISAKIGMTSSATSFEQFNTDVKAHYSGKVNTLKGSTDYTDLITKFELTSTKTTIDGIISSNAKDRGGTLDPIKKQAYQQWAYYALVLAIAKQIPTSCISNTVSISDAQANPPLTADQKTDYAAFLRKLDSDLNGLPNVADARKFNPTSSP